MRRSCLLVLLVLFGQFVLVVAPARAGTPAISNCPTGVGDRNAVIESLHTLGSRLAMGRICAVQEDSLQQLKQQTLNRYAGCLLNFQIKATEIQDALEAMRPAAHITWRQAKDKQQLCEQVRLATN